MEQRDDLTVAEISDALGFPSASAYRIVNTLLDREFLQRGAFRGSFRLGLRLMRLGRLVESNLELRQIARPVMERLSATTGETAVLWTPRRDEAVCIENIEGSSPIRPVSVGVGESRPYTLGAAPLAILAFLPQSDQSRIVQTIPRKERQALEARLQSIRGRQFVITEGEMIPGTAAVAAPIYGPDPHSAVGALALTGIIDRMRGLDPFVRSAATEISRLLGADLLES